MIAACAASRGAGRPALADRPRRHIDAGERSAATSPLDMGARKRSERSPTKRGSAAPAFEDVFLSPDDDGHGERSGANSPPALTLQAMAVELEKKLRSSEERAVKTSALDATSAEKRAAMAREVARKERERLRSARRRRHQTKEQREKERLRSRNRRLQMTEKQRSTEAQNKLKRRASAKQQKETFEAATTLAEAVGDGKPAESFA